MRIYPNLKRKMHPNVYIILALLVFILGLFSTISRADCQDPSTLSPQLKKAYYELKKAAAELGGFSVSIKCYSQGGATH